MNDDPASDCDRTILFKLSGELLAGGQKSGIDPDETDRVAGELADVVRAGVRTGVVIGGGNFFRGGKSSDHSLSEYRGHQMGMLFTIANAIALEQALLDQDVSAVVQSSIGIPSIVEQFDDRSSEKYLDEGCVMIYAGGTGNTHFSTDTAASLRAIQIGADILLKATRVDGIYNSDPQRDADAVRLGDLTYEEVLTMNLGVMDATSVALCRQHNLPIRVFNATVRGGISRAGLGGEDGTLVSGE